jgi:hypothetical protein
MSTAETPVEFNSGENELFHKLERLLENLGQLYAFLAWIGSAILTVVLGLLIAGYVVQDPQKSPPPSSAAAPAAADSPAIASKKAKEKKAKDPITVGDLAESSFLLGLCVLGVICGRAMRASGRAFKRIVDTTGEDRPRLMEALTQLVRATVAEMSVAALLCATLGLSLARLVAGR